MAVNHGVGGSSPPGDVLFIETRTEDLSEANNLALK